MPMANVAWILIATAAEGWVMSGVSARQPNATAP